MKKALIVGIDSAIGKALEKELLDAGWMVFGTSRKMEHINTRIFYLDLSNASAFQIDFHIDVVFLCASITKMSSCREHEQYAEIVNKDAQIILANYFIKRKAHIVFLSTVGVFDGQKAAYRIDDQTNPNTLYGKYKAFVEDELLKMSSLISIVRLTKVLTPDYSLITNWLSLLKQGNSISPFYDLNLAPVSIHLVTNCLKKIAEEKIDGIVHLSGESDVSYLQLALYFAQEMKVDTRLIEPKSAIESGIPLSEIPRYASLDITKTKEIFDLENVSLTTTLASLYSGWWGNKNNNCSLQEITLD